MGVAATFTMDQLGRGARRLGWPAGITARWIGRWFLGILSGRVFYSNIAAAPERPREGLVTLLTHYAIGIVLAIVYLIGTPWLAVSPSKLPVALSYGLATNVFPWFLMFPAMGFGLLGVKSPAGRNLFVPTEPFLLRVRALVDRRVAPYRLVGATRRFGDICNPPAS